MVARSSPGWSSAWQPARPPAGWSRCHWGKKTGIQFLGFHKDLMLGFVLKPDDLILDRRAIPRPRGIDHPHIHRGSVQVVADDVMRTFIGIREVAGNLRVRDGAKSGMKTGAAGRRGLHAHDVEINRIPMQSWRRAPFSSARLQSRNPSCNPKDIPRRLSGSSAGHMAHADMNQSL